MGPRVVLDTNVLVSALGWRGPSHSIVEKCQTGEIRLLLSLEILRELERVLRYPKLGFSEEEIAEYLGLLAQIADLVEPGFRLSVVEEDPSDNRFLECALAGEADYVVSGDRHLKALGSFEGIPILPPQEFLEVLEEP